MLLRSARSAAVLLALAATVAGAAEQDPIKVAERLNRKAMEDYDNLEFDAAKQKLSRALAKLSEAGLDETPTAAKVYINLGMVYFVADKDKGRAENQFVEALKIDGEAALDPDRSTPELHDVFAEAKKKVPARARKPPPAPAPVEPPLPAAHGLEHTPVEEVRAGSAIAFKARLGTDVEAKALFLFYRSGGQEEYQAVPMARGKRGEWIATLAPDAVSGKTVHYYLEAQDGAGQPAARSGSADSPNLISIVGDKPAGLANAGRVEEDPLARQRQDRADAEQDRASTRGYGRLFINLMAGSGLGVEFAGNQYEVAYRYSKTAFNNGTLGGYLPLSVDTSGAALSPLHFAPEIGVNLNRHMAVSVIGRIELTLINNADSSTSNDTSSVNNSPGPGSGTTKAVSAFAGLARFHYNFLEGRFHPGVHVGIGGGQIRHVLDITNANATNSPLSDQSTAMFYGPGSTANKNGIDPTMATTFPRNINQVCYQKNPCYDNIAVGIFLASIGGSFSYDVVTWKNGGFDVRADLAAIIAAGQQFGLTFDLALGVGAHFL